MLSGLPTWCILPLLVATFGILGIPFARRVDADADPVIDRVLLRVLMGAIAYSWIGTILAALGMMRWYYVAPVLLGLGVWQYLVRKAQATPSPLSHSPLWATLGIVGILGVAGWLYSKPSESYFYADDPGAYTVGGAALARTGSLLYRPDVPWWGGEGIAPTSLYRYAFHVADSGMVTRHRLHVYQLTPRSTQVEMGFLPLTKVWIALSARLFGLPRANWTIPLLALLSLCAMYGLLKDTRNPLTALVVCAVMAPNLAQVWFGRHPTSEMVAQAFCLGGLYLLNRSRRSADTPEVARRLAVWSALSFATLCITRIEATLILGLIAVVILLVWRTDDSTRQAKRTWVVALAILSLFGTMLSIVVARNYFFVSIPLSPGVAAPVILAALFGVAVLMLVIAYPQVSHVILGWASRAHWVPTVMLVVSLVLLVGVGLLRQGDSFLHWVYLYATPLGVVASVIGGVMVFAATRDKSPELCSLLVTALLFLILYARHNYVTPVHPWAIRRGQVVVMPAVYAAIGIGLTLPVHPLPGTFMVGKWLPRVGTVIVLVLASAQVYLSIQRSDAVIAHYEQRGFLQGLGSVLGKLEPRSVLIFDNGDLAGALSQPSEFVFAHPAIMLYIEPSAHETDIDNLIQACLDRGRSVYFVATDGDLIWSPARWSMESVGAGRFTVPILRQPQGRLPAREDIVNREIVLDLYRLVPRIDGRTTSVRVSPAEGAYPYLRAGFYGTEYGAGGLPARWTDGRGLVTLPWPTETTSLDSGCLQLDIAGPRFDGFALTDITITVEGTQLYRERFQATFEPTRLQLPLQSVANRNDEALEIAIESDTWRPDGRDLGALLYGLEFHVGGCSPN